MPTVKLVVIGASGVGKTSLRGQYISGRFSNGYRATIGADFITKTLPHPSDPADTVTLQIWDTAGQERFSSLSTAFFRGADAALLMFDVNTPETMTALTKWWAEFRERAPLADEDMEDYCCVVVGNKMDLAGSGGKSGEQPVSEVEARQFLDKLVPVTSRSPSPTYGFPLLEEPPEEESDDDLLASSVNTIRPPDTLESDQSSTRPPRPPSPHQMRSDSIAIIPNGSTNTHHQPTLSPSHSPKHHLSKSRSRSASHFYGGTMTTTHTTLTIYHTPSSSLFDVFQSARTSPEPWSSSSHTATSPSSSPSASSSPSTSTYPSIRGRRATALSTGSASSGSAATITPSLFAREHTAGPSSSPITEDLDPDLALQPFAVPLPPPPARGPKLFFTSAKTGDGVSDVFEYIARRVVRRWEYEERIEARRMHVREASAADTIRLGLERKKGVGVGAGVGACCGA
ncbi:ras-domain-containing protein [Lyophyllum atratum]|nr:ras-domain-containing protein [Lyophyllum atratum]